MSQFCLIRVWCYLRKKKTIIFESIEKGCRKTTRNFVWRINETKDGSFWLKRVRKRIKIIGKETLILISY